MTRQQQITREQVWFKIDNAVRLAAAARFRGDTATANKHEADAAVWRKVFEGR